MLQKQAVPLNFSMGLDLKTDPKQVQLGHFLALSNSIFDKGGSLQKRNGYEELASLPDLTSTTATTFNGDLTAIGNSIQSYSGNLNEWFNKGPYFPMEVDTLPLISSNLEQSQCDSVVAPNGLICTVFIDNPAAGPIVKYVIADSVTGQNVAPPQVIPVTSGTVTGAARVFLLNNYFVIVFTNVISATSHLQYIAIPINNPAASSGTAGNVNISSTYTPADTLAFDGVIYNNSLYIAWNATSSEIKVNRLDSFLHLQGEIVFTSSVATMFTLCADINGNIFISYYDSGSSNGFMVIVDKQLNVIRTPISIITSTTVLNMASISSDQGTAELVYEVSNTYGYSSVPTNFIQFQFLVLTGPQGSPSILIRSLGLASKAFLMNGDMFFLATYQSPNQSTYFIINLEGQCVAKLAYSNGGGYLVTGLPNITVNGDVVQIPYLFKDFLVAVSKDQSTTSTGIYSQTGINLATFTFNTKKIVAAEIGNNLNISGGFLWSYDGYLPVEQGFHLYPDSIKATSTTTGGHLDDSTYFYQAVYEWSDNQGNIFRSAPSVPFELIITGTSLSTNKATINVPTLRITYKIANPVKLTVYRWSTVTPIYYEITSISSPILNDPTVDYVSILDDTFSETTIVGQPILYTTGGVVEDIGPPPTSTMALFKSRLFLVDAEDKNLLWFSKQVIEATPVEMSDLFTIFIPPTTSVQGSTGPITALSAMDDKLIIFKKDAIYYLTGDGPDNTGNNNDFSEPIFVTSTIGCTNQASIVFMPQGLMFQSANGIWLLGRDLSTQYIGAAVEDFNQFAVNSASNIPATNQVRFTLSSGITLMYDYYYGQWGTFTGVSAISSTVFESLHTFINQYGQVFQENPGSYVDGSNPVLMSFTTSWINLAGVRGYQRAYFFTLLGTYISPHKLSLQITYDYSPGVNQQTIILPYNFNAPWGGDSTWGQSTPWGGAPTLEQWKVHLARQTCQSFQITMNEVFDSSYGTVAGAGLTLSGLSLIVGIKKGYRPFGERTSAG